MKSIAAALTADQVLSTPCLRAEHQRKVRTVSKAKMCRHCNKPLPLMRSFFNERFCNNAHEHAYLKEMEVLALERLRQAAERLRLNIRPASPDALLDPLSDPPGMF